MGRHRHVTCVRTDGLSAVLRPLLADPAIVAATLADVGCGMLLDGWTGTEALADLELLGAAHVDMLRASEAAGGTGEVTVSVGDRHHLLAPVADPHGDRLVLAVVVDGGLRRAARARRRLRSVSVTALTSGPDLALRPVDGAWRTPVRDEPPAPGPPTPAPDPPPLTDPATSPARIPARTRAPGPGSPAPPVAMPGGPAPRR